MPKLSSEAVSAYQEALKGVVFTADSEIPGVAELVDVGLLAALAGGKRLEPVDPHLVEARLTSEWRNQAWQLELRATELEQQLAPVAHLYAERRKSEQSAVGYIQGMKEIQEYVCHVSREAKEEILTAQPGGGRSAEVLSRALPLAKEGLLRGVRMLTLYQHSARFNEPTKKYVAEVTECGAQVRTLEEFFERLFVIDRSLAILPAAQNREVAIVVHDQVLVRFLADVFDRSWQRAVPFVRTGAAHASSEVMPDIHNMIKRLLVQGLTDAVIARRVGIAERTYHNHLARIRAELGAKSRLQLGYLLAQEQLMAVPAPGGGAPFVSAGVGEGPDVTEGRTA